MRALEERALLFEASHVQPVGCLYPARDARWACSQCRNTFHSLCICPFTQLDAWSALHRTQAQAIVVCSKHSSKVVALNCNTAAWQICLQLVQLYTWAFFRSWSWDETYHLARGQKLKSPFSWLGDEGVRGRPLHFPFQWDHWR